MPSVNFDPSTHDYSAGNALLLGYASDIAYDDPPEAAPKFAQHGLAVEKSTTSKPTASTPRPTWSVTTSA